MESIRTKLPFAGVVAILTLLPPFSAHSGSPAQEKGIPSAFLRTLVGKSHRSKELCKLRRLLKEDPLASYVPDYGILLGFSHRWPTRGIEVHFDEKDLVDVIFLYGGLTKESTRGYAFELPYKLAFKDSVETVKKKIGPPEKILKGLDDLPTIFIYDALGLDVAFDTHKFAQGKATVIRVNLRTAVKMSKR